MKAINQYSSNIKIRLIKDNLFKYLVITLAGLTSFPLFLILYQLIVKGYRQLNLSFFTEVAPDTMQAMLANKSGELIPGGIVNGILGTLLIIGMASLMAIPMGVICGVYLSEYKDTKFAGLVRFIADMLQAVPSIVLGIIGYIWIVRPLTNGFSAFAGSIALAIMMLPAIIRSTEESLKMLPESLKEAAISLGVPYHKVVLKLLLPTGISGILTGIILAVSRIAGETAPLMLTALGSNFINWDISKPTSAIPLLIWEFYNDPNLINMIWSASLFLLILIFILNMLAKFVTRKWRVQH
ncbi:MAG: phosphate ABC transporter permease PstA [Marinifilaceae bacterium]|jgi:phosphate transport system permease protein|nr:phosphate ABC transporter permease PstA [Marinifilaceae bacterium]